MSNLTATEIARIEALVSANTQPVTVVLDRKTYSVPYRFVAGIRASRRTGRIIGGQGTARRDFTRAMVEMAKEMGTDPTTARRIAREVR